MTTKKPWGGRFSADTNPVVEAFTASEHFDRRLAKFDIEGSGAHARALVHAGILTDSEYVDIVAALDVIAGQIDNGDFNWRPSLEDVHMNIETALTEAIGESGKKIHTGRSRNDQVATDMRLYVRSQIDVLDQNMENLMEVLVQIAERESESIMPGYTHLQCAQPITLGHHMLAWFEMLARDRQRLADCRRRVNVSPLGCAALAGNTFGLDRQLTADLLGFEDVARNSLDAVSDRDFLMELGGHLAILMVHLSRIAEELVTWSSQKYSFVDLGDTFCTGSSIMPQKKNPDVAELIRGKSSRVIGSAVALLVMMKAQPLAYNRDNQEDKRPVFEALDETIACVEVLGLMLAQASFDRDALYSAASDGFATATDLADYLVRRGIPFRDAHEIVGKAVASAQAGKLQLHELTLEQFQEFSDAIHPDVYEVLTLEGSVNARNHVGGTAPVQVRQAAAEARQRIAGRA